MPGDDPTQDIKDVAEVFNNSIKSAKVPVISAGQTNQLRIIN